MRNLMDVVLILDKGVPLVYVFDFTFLGLISMEIFSVEPI